MYRLINTHIEVLLSHINQAKDIHPYLQILRHCQTSSGRSSFVFRDAYKRFYGLERICGREGFEDAYFGILEARYDSRAIEVEEVTRELQRWTSQQGGQETTEFSFASKLAHTIDPSLPIYDRNVLKFYMLRDADTSSGIDSKLRILMRTYRFLQREYKRVIEVGLLTPSIVALRERYKLPELFTDIKVIDTLIWKFVDLMRHRLKKNIVVPYQ